MSDLISREALIENFGLKNATKYGNKDAEQQAHSYSTLMLYEIADMIEDAPAVEAVPKSYAEQIRWERDVAVGQLNEIGCQFGQKMDEVKDKLNSAKNWIPCSERLPDIKEGKYASDCVLVTLKWWDGEISETVGWYNRTGTWSEGGKMSKVIAWMPYEPYKGE